MVERKRPRKVAIERLRSDRGVSLVETMLAVVIAVVGMFGLGNLIFKASVTNKNMGTETTRAVIYAQDKIEKILSLASVPTNSGQADYVACTQAASSQPSVCNTTGITGSGWTTGLLAGGSTAPVQIGCPSSGSNVGYMDFLDASGAQFDACANPTATFAYVRQWQISDLTTSSTPAAFAGGPAVKQVTVAVYSLSAVNTNGGKPVVVLSSVVSNPN